MALKHFCTITTIDFLYKTKALHASLQKCCKDFSFHVLVTDAASLPLNENEIQYYDTSILKSETALAIINKYRANANKLRWSLKPVFILHLLQNFEKVIYTDNDIAFFNSPDFLFEALDHNPILLTPHHYAHSPQKNQNWLEANFTIGLYNAGFVGANRDAKKTLEWWAACCLYRCEKSRWRGLFDDQKYLDLVPIIEPLTKVLTHKGCNLAGWNIDTCERTLSNNEVLIEGKYQVVFIHLNDYTIRMIVEGKDPLLESYWQQYLSTLQSFKKGLQQHNLYRPQSFTEKLRLAVWQLLS